MSTNRKHWPGWVWLGLWGLDNRFAAMSFCWMSVAGAVACLVAGFFFWPAFFGVGLVFAALWYYLSVRWVDAHGGWNTPADPRPRD